jgi:hypothetical protein
MSPPRKFSGKVKPGMGVDGTEGESFTKRNTTNPWDPPKMGREYSRPGAYTNNESGLRDTGTDPENYAKIDVFDMVESQSDKTGPVKLRKQDR